ncbi:hypothetical protein B0F90DRAFT_298757 [Multifurca ochricompacta]|uniref:Uncharacterized protein n=1 Tax=Multifurca ochricompacta TaxID=376703 RepID=A0AAD4LXU9_9AGAM|nr:hypothetical protein B0F90DRAFT_298757 [Multifurca ochricompacta]
MRAIRQTCDRPHTRNKKITLCWMLFKPQFFNNATCYTLTHWVFSAPTIICHPITTCTGPKDESPPFFFDFAPSPSILSRTSITWRTSFTTFKGSRSACERESPRTDDAVAFVSSLIKSFGFFFNILQLTQWPRCFIFFDPAVARQDKRFF